MTVYIFYFILTLLPIMWITSIVWLKKWKYFLPYILINNLLILIYVFVIFYSSITLYVHDEYGLKKIFLFLFIIGFQTIIGFIFALYFKFKLSKKVINTNIL